MDITIAVVGCDPDWGGGMGIEVLMEGKLRL